MASRPVRTIPPRHFVRSKIDSVHRKQMTWSLLLLSSRKANAFRSLHRVEKYYVRRKNLTQQHQPTTTTRINHTPAKSTTPTIRHHTSKSSHVVSLAQTLFPPTSPRHKNKIAAGSGTPRKREHTHRNQSINRDTQRGVLCRAPLLVY
ncbi:unnamed protein product [Ectocarpus sp. 12 AP-2014]